MAITNNIIKDLSLCVWLVRGNKKNKTIKTYSCDSNVMIWDEFDHDLTCVWPDPKATLTHICHSRPGEEVVLSEARPDTQH